MATLSTDYKAWVDEACRAAAECPECGGDGVIDTECCECGMEREKECEICHGQDWTDQFLRGIDQREKERIFPRAEFLRCLYSNAWDLEKWTGRTRFEWLLEAGITIASDLSNTKPYIQLYHCKHYYSGRQVENEAA